MSCKRNVTQTFRVLIHGAWPVHKFKHSHMDDLLLNIHYNCNFIRKVEKDV